MNSTQWLWRHHPKIAWALVVWCFCMAALFGLVLVWEVVK